MLKIELQWKAFKVDLTALDQQLRADHPEYVGNQAHNVLELWFNADIGESAKSSIEALWASIDENSALAQSYKSQEQVGAAKEVKKASAAAKLEALGLTADEVKALLGQ